MLSKDNYGKFKEEEFERKIKKLLLNEDKELLKHIEKYIFIKLSWQYNFMKEDKKTSINKSPEVLASGYMDMVILKIIFIFQKEVNWNK